ncbi:MAG: GatB/YqeY domain-containing protein, partial [Dehalococcoidia bacterium]|nr:GatB/YqeY domain-containing protein [Dehalococcoidia bacterium]
VIRMLLSAINYSEIAKQATLSDSDIFGVISKEMKQRKESIAAYSAANRPELAAKEEAEMNILKAYLPEQMSREEISALVKKLIAEVGCLGPQDKNKLMPKLMPLVKGKADGQEVNAIVNELLNG